MSAFPPGYQLRGPSTKHPPKSWNLRVKDYKGSLAGGLGGCPGPQERERGRVMSAWVGWCGCGAGAVLCGL